MPDPISAQIVRVFESQRPNRAIARKVVEGQKTTIVERTNSGVDGQGNAFHPYSTKGPYYWSPDHHGQTIKQRKASVGHYLRQTTKIGNLLAGTKAERSSIGGVRSKTGLSIRFESYADFKQSFGRPNVDLFGIINHPHMMNGIIIQPTTGTPDHLSIAMGIYSDDLSERASGHVEGARFLPKRDFWQTTEKDMDRMQRELEQAVTSA